MAGCFLAVFLTILSAVSVNADFGNFKTIDLSYQQDEEARGWPTVKRYQQKVAHAAYSVDDGVPEQW